MWHQAFLQFLYMKKGAPHHRRQAVCTNKYCAWYIMKCVLSRSRMPMFLPTIYSLSFVTVNGYWQLGRWVFWIWISFSNTHLTTCQYFLFSQHQWSYMGWQNWNPLSHPNATLAPQARQARTSGENLNYVTLVPQARPSSEILNYLLSRQSDILVRSLRNV